MGNFGFQELLLIFIIIFAPIIALIILILKYVKLKKKVKESENIIPKKIY